MIVLVAIALLSVASALPTPQQAELIDFRPLIVPEEVVEAMNNEAKAIQDDGVAVNFVDSAINEEVNSDDGIAVKFVDSSNADEDLSAVQFVNNNEENIGDFAENDGSVANFADSPIDENDGSVVNFVDSPIDENDGAIVNFVDSPIDENYGSAVNFVDSPVDENDGSAVNFVDSPIDENDGSAVNFVDSPIDENDGAIVNFVDSPIDENDGSAVNFVDSPVDENDGSAVNFVDSPVDENDGSFVNFVDSADAGYEAAALVNESPVIDAIAVNFVDSDVADIILIGDIYESLRPSELESVRVIDDVSYPSKIYDNPLLR